MRDYNQINLGKLRHNPPKKGGRYSTSSLAVNQQAQQHHRSYEEEKKVDQDTTTPSSGLYMPSPQGRPSISIASNTPTPFSFPSQRQSSQQKKSSLSLSSQHPQLSDSSYHAPSLEAANITDPSSPLQAGDALSIRQQGAEATIVKLRSALDEASLQDSSAKSDAVILELRSSLRQVKRQLDRVQEEKAALEKERTITTNNMPQSSYNAASMDARVGELQVQLDRAHAQILTADMARKELEDTLEAEQYTWELRVQDQEHQIVELQLKNDQLTANVENLTKQLEKIKSQHSQEGTDWQEMKPSINHQDTAHMHETLVTLEQERAELQAFLDEALKELELVDEELKTDPNASTKSSNYSDQALVNSLQHLHRLVLERDGIDYKDHTIPQEPREIIASIHTHMDNTPPSSSNKNNTDSVQRSVPSSSNDERLRQVEQELATCKRDLQTIEEGAAELRASLKEAVSVIRPLQNAVAKSDREKTRLQQELDQQRTRADATIEQTKNLKSELSLREQETDRLRQEISNLEIQLIRERAKTATSLVQAQKTAATHSPTESAQARLRAKRAEEEALKQMLGNARSRFRAFQQQNSDVESLNFELQGKDPVMSTRVQDLEKKLKDTVLELRSKKEAEKKLNKCLKEALNLLRPLQKHLEEAELEKKQMAVIIEALEQQIHISKSGSPSNSKEEDLKHNFQDMEYAVSFGIFT